MLLYVLDGSWEIVSMLNFVDHLLPSARAVPVASIASEALSAARGLGETAWLGWALALLLGPFRMPWLRGEEGRDVDDVLEESPFCHLLNFCLSQALEVCLGAQLDLGLCLQLLCLLLALRLSLGLSLCLRLGLRLGLRLCLCLELRLVD